MKKNVEAVTEPSADSKRESGISMINPERASRIRLLEEAEQYLGENREELLKLVTTQANKPLSMDFSSTLVEKGYKAVIASPGDLELLLQNITNEKRRLDNPDEALSSETVTL